MAIKHKIALSFSLLLILVLAAFWLSLRLQLSQTLSQQTDTLGDILSRQIADSVTELVLANDLLGMNVVLNQLARQNGVASVTLADVDGKVLASTAGAEVAAQLSTPYIAPITLQDAVAGYVQLHLDTTLLSNPVAQPDTLLYLIIAFGLVLVLATSYALASHLTTPLHTLLVRTDPETLDAADAGEDALEHLVDRRDETGLLQQRFADLLYRLRELEELTATTGIPDEDPEQQGGLRPERRMATLLLVQVANSDTAIELLHPATLAKLLQQYQFYLRQAARLYRGVVSRISGDTVLVSFDTRRCQDEHAFDALCCAQLFLRLMHELATAQRSRHAQALEFSLAVHSGDVYFSPIWIKTRAGEERPRVESVIGKPVRLAEELLVECYPGELLVSELCYDLADGKARFDTVDDRKVTLGADRLELIAYSLSPTAGAHNELLERQVQHLLPDLTQSAAD